MKRYYSDNYCDVEVKGNMIAGIFGALLFSLAGVVLWIAIYQIGFIAGATGIVMLIATIQGYKLFGGKVTLFASIICFIISVIMIIVAELSCVAFEIYKAYKNEYFITIFDALRALPEFLKEPDVIKDVKFDLFMGFTLTFVAIVFEFINVRPYTNTSQNKTTIKRNEVGSENATVTRKVGIWRKVFSFWSVIFTLGGFFTSWITFLYLGIRLKKPILLLWCIFYLAPFVLMFFINDNTSGVYTILFVLLVIFSFIMGIIHAIKVCARNLSDYVGTIEQID